MSLFSKTSISVEELKHLFLNKTPVKIIDIRSQSNFEDWHISGSELVPVNEALQITDDNVFFDLGFKSDLPVIVVCMEGFLSRKAVEQLCDLGIEAYSLEGGIREWTKVWNTAKHEVNKHLVIQIRRVGKGCLSYMIINDNEAVVIDPAVDVDVYIQLAKEHNATIKYVMDTHIHADHFSRGKQLADRVNATLLVPDQDFVKYPFTPVKHLDKIHFGQSVLQAWHTPGHTTESVSYRLGNDLFFSGDLLFINGVGRSDLKSGEAEARKKASKLYSSLKLLEKLPDNCLVLPAHYHKAIAFDDKVIKAKLGDLKQSLNLLQLDEKSFIDEILKDLPETPPNFEQIINLNIQGTPGEHDLLELEAGENRCGHQ